MNHTIIFPDLVKQVLAFVTGDPERVTTAVVTEAGEIQLVDSEIMMVEPVGLLQQPGVKSGPAEDRSRSTDPDDVPSTQRCGHSECS